MKLMKSKRNSSIIILFTITLLTGFIAIAYTQFVQAQIPGTGFDLSGIPGLNLLKGPNGDNGDTGATGAQWPAGPVGPKGDTGANGDTGATGAQGPKGNTGAQGEQGPPDEGVKFGNLNVIVHTIAGFSSDFTIHVTGNLESSGTFPGSETGTQVLWGFGRYAVTEDTQFNNVFLTSYSHDCNSVMNLNEMKTCTITNDRPPGWFKVK